MSRPQAGRGSGRGRGRGQGRGQQWQHSTGRNDTNTPSLSDLKQAEETRRTELFKSRRGIDTSECKLEEFERHLPDLFKAPTWKDAKLMAVKEALNETKNKMDAMDIREWNNLARKTNRTQHIVRALRDQQTEMATIAWAKMWETLRRYHFFPYCQQTPQGPVWQHVPPGGVRNPPIAHLPVAALADTMHMARKAGCSVHLCEAPGAFVAATNQYVRTELGYLDWQWRAMTLSPYHVGNDAAAMVEDDALLVQTKPNWHFGRDKSGDIRKQDNIVCLWEDCRTWFDAQGLPGAALVTADGSIDCQEHPNEQEAMTASLHYAELIAAMGLLAPGGSVFLKSFTIFEHSTFAMLYLCGLFFDRVDVYKPATSKANNSETYITCCGFRGIERCEGGLLHSLLRHVGDDTFDAMTMLPREAMPESFVHSVVHVGAWFAERTRETLEDALSRRVMSRIAAEVLQESQTECARLWLENFGPRPLHPDLRLAPDVELTGRDNRTDTQRQTDFAGTLEERRKMYQERRLKNGVQAGRVIQKMREEAGLAKDASAKKAAEAPAAAPPPWQSNGAQSKVLKMMEAQGYKAGQGLGTQLQGITAPVDAGAQQRRAGLGFNAASATAAADWTLRPDTDAFVNEGLAWEGEDPDTGIVGPLVPTGPDVDTLTYAWQHEQAPCLPQDVRNSKVLHSEVFLELKGLRRRAAEALQTRSGRAACGGICQHHGPCAAPRSTRHMRRAFWKLAALDVQLSHWTPTDSFGARPALLPYFLKSPDIAQKARTTVCCLSMHDAGALDYVLSAHATPQHAMQLERAFAFEGAKPSGGQPHALRGLVHTLASTVPAPAAHAPQAAKLACFTAAACAELHAQVGTADVIIGDLSSMARDVPHAQQLSVWQEFNTVFRRRLVWEAAVALRCCAVGGSAILRVGDLLTTFTTGLLCVLARNFTRFHVVKPFSSCAASAEAFAVFVGRAADPGAEPGAADDTGDVQLVRSSHEYLLQKLKVMEAVEAPGELPEDDARPGAALLCNSHVSDIIDPESYAGDVSMQYMQRRCVALAQRQVEVLRALLDAPQLQQSATREEEQFAVDKACQALFSGKAVQLTDAKADSVLVPERSVQVIAPQQTTATVDDTGLGEGGRAASGAGLGLGLGAQARPATGAPESESTGAPLFVSGGARPAELPIEQHALAAGKTPPSGGLAGAGSRRHTSAEEASTIVAAVTRPPAAGHAEDSSTCEVQGTPTFGSAGAANGEADPKDAESSAVPAGVRAKRSLCLDKAGSAQQSSGILTEQGSLETSINGRPNVLLAVNSKRKRGQAKGGKHKACKAKQDRNGQCPHQQGWGLGLQIPVDDPFRDYAKHVWHEDAKELGWQDTGQFRGWFLGVAKAQDLLDNAADRKGGGAKGTA